MEKRRYNYGDYIKHIQYLDHTLFKVIEQFVPFKANTKTGLVVEPHFLERSKFKRTLPVRSDAQTAIPGTHQNVETDLNLTYYSGSIYTLEDSSVVSIGNLSTTTSSRGKRIDKGTNGTITIYDDYLDPSQKDDGVEELKKKVSLDFKPEIQDEVSKEKAPNPDCTEAVCMPSFWVPERNLCIYCGQR